MKAYFGTSTDIESKGIYFFKFDSNKDDDACLYQSIKQPKYLCADNEYLYTVFQKDIGAGIRIYHKECIVQELIYEYYPSCYILVKPPYIYTVNYHESTLTKLSFLDNRLQFVKTISFEENAGPHQVIVDGDNLIVPCLLQDELIILNEELEVISRQSFKKYTGPRHGLIFENHLYLVSEISNEVYQFKKDKEGWKLKDKANLLLPFEKGHAAGISVDTDGKRLFISIRGINQIAVFTVINQHLKMIKRLDCFGDHPRFIRWIKSKQNLCVANRFSNEVVLIDIEKERVVQRIKVFEPTCVEVIYEE
ncbi:MAG: beta-propeller fold lactonase family protein [Erysipelotrichaceae bacterium]